MLAKFKFSVLVLTFGFLSGCGGETATSDSNDPPQSTAPSQSNDALQLTETSSTALNSSTSSNSENPNTSLSLNGGTEERPDNLLKQGVMAQLNELRQTLGLDPYDYDANLADAAQNHQDYLAANGVYSDRQSRALTGYTGVTAQDRASFTGYADSVLSATSFSAESDDSAVMDLMADPTSRLALLAWQVDTMGMGSAELIRSEQSVSILVADEEQAAEVVDDNRPIMAWPTQTFPVAPKILMDKRSEDKGCQMANYPLSVQLNPELSQFIHLLSDTFTLQRLGRTQKIALDVTTQSNWLTSENWIDRLPALVAMPTEALDWGATYQASVDYWDNRTGVVETYRWLVKTQASSDEVVWLEELPINTINGRYRLTLAPGQSVELNTLPQSCQDRISELDIHTIYRGDGVELLSNQSLKVLGGKISGPEGIILTRFMIKSQDSSVADRVVEVRVEE